MESSVRIARIELQKTRTQENYALIKELVRNPVLELLGGAALINLMARYPSQNPLLSGFEEKVGSAALISIISAQQLAPLVSGLGGSSGIFELIKTIVPVFAK